MPMKMILRAAVPSASSELAPLKDRLTAALPEDLNPKTVHDIQLIFEEAFMNAIRHGNDRDPSKKVEIAVCLNQQNILFDIQDEGEGFDPSAVPDPTDPENLEKPSGRGLLMMRHYTNDAVTFNRTGNKVMMRKALRG